MKTTTVLRGMLLLAFVFALFVWTSVPSPVRAIECPPGQVPQEQFNGTTRQWVLVCVPQEWLPAVVNPPVNPLPPTEPSKWDQAPRMTGVFGPGGGSLDGPGGDTTVTVPAGVLPDGSQLTLTRPPLNGLRPGTLALRGDGDHIVTVSACNMATNQPGLSRFYNNVTVCFNLSDQEVAHAGGPQNLYIDQWDGSLWVRTLLMPEIPPAFFVSDTSVAPPKPWRNFCAKPAPPVQDTDAFATCP